MRDNVHFIKCLLLHLMVLIVCLQNVVCSTTVTSTSLSSPTLASKLIDPDLVTFFSLIDKNGDGVISESEMALFLKLFYGHGDDNDESKIQDMLFAKHVDEVRYGFIEENRDNLRQLLKQMDRLFGRQDRQFASQLNHAGEWSVTFQEFEKIFSMTPQFSLSQRKQGSNSRTCPEQIRLSLGRQTLTEMVVMWVTKQSTIQSIVQYGTMKNNLEFSASGTNYTYQAGVFGWDGWIHKVFLKNLQPSTTYYYRVGGGDVSHSCWGEVLSFTTPSPPGRQKYPVSIATFGDMGTVMPMGFMVTKSIIRQNKAHKFDMVVHVGDISYAGTGKVWEFEYIWDLWGRQVSPLSSTMPYMVSVGNHEKYYNFTSFVNRFHMPGDRTGDLKHLSNLDDAPPSNGNYFYSWDYAGIHFVSMSTERYVADYMPGTDGYRWLEYDLNKANLNRATIPWIVFLGHRPMYTSDEGSNSGPLQSGVEPLLYKYKVELAIWGHQHCYERTWPVFNNIPVVDPQTITKQVYVNPQATTHLTIGTAGAHISEKWVEPQPEWSLHREATYGFVRFNIVNATALHFQFIKEHNDVVNDEFWIIKK